MKKHDPIWPHPFAGWMMWMEVWRFWQVACAAWLPQPLPRNPEGARAPSADGKQPDWAADRYDSALWREVPAPAPRSEDRGEAAAAPRIIPIESVTEHAQDLSAPALDTAFADAGNGSLTAAEAVNLDAEVAETEDRLADAAVALALDDPSVESASGDEGGRLEAESGDGSLSEEQAQNAAIASLAADALTEAEAETAESPSEAENELVAFDANMSGEVTEAISAAQAPELPIAAMEAEQEIAQESCEEAAPDVDESALAEAGVQAEIYAGIAVSEAYGGKSLTEAADQPAAQNDNAPVFDCAAPEESVDPLAADSPDEDCAEERLPEGVASAEILIANSGGEGSAGIDAKEEAQMLSPLSDPASHSVDGRPEAIYAEDGGCEDIEYETGEADEDDAGREAGTRRRRKPESPSSRSTLAASDVSAPAVILGDILHEDKTGLLEERETAEGGGGQADAQTENSAFEASGAADRGAIEAQDTVDEAGSSANSLAAQRRQTHRNSE